MDKKMILSPGTFKIESQVWVDRGLTISDLEAYMEICKPVMDLFLEIQRIY